VIYTTSPFVVDFTDQVEDVLNPAINGTNEILRAVKARAPSIKRVVVTSSFAAIANTVPPPPPNDETSWNLVTWEEAVADRSLTYRGSKVRAVILKPL
jgi:nucleoside-diphosphate-sugar epimerase